MSTNPNDTAADPGKALADHVRDMLIASARASIPETMFSGPGPTSLLAAGTLNGAAREQPTTADVATLARDLSAHYAGGDDGTQDEVK